MPTAPLGIAAWNVSRGGFPSYAPTDRWPERLHAIKAAVRGLDARVIGLTDTLRWHQMFPPHQLEEMFGCRFALAADIGCKRLTDDAPIGITLLARGETGRTMRAEVVRLGGRNVIRATFWLAGTMHVLYLVYMHHLYLDARIAQTEAIIADAQATYPAGTPVMVFGDFNASNHPPLLARIARPLLSLPPFNFARHNVLARARGLGDRRVMRRFYAAGWHDARPPGRPDPTHYVGGQDSRFRVPFAVDSILLRNWPRPITDFATTWHTGASDHAVISVNG